MNKKKILLVIIVMIFLGLGIGDFILDARWKPLGNMSHNMKEPKTFSSDFSFQAVKGMRVRIDIGTMVEGGTVDFVLSDSKGNIIEKLPKAKELVTYVIFDYDDTYTLTAICNDFIGKYRGKVSIKRF